MAVSAFLPNLRASARAPSGAQKGRDRLPGNLVTDQQIQIGLPDQVNRIILASRRCGMAVRRQNSSNCGFGPALTAFIEMRGVSICLINSPAMRPSSPLQDDHVPFAARGAALGFSGSPDCGPQIGAVEFFRSFAQCGGERVGIAGENRRLGIPRGRRFAIQFRYSGQNAPKVAGALPPKALRHTLEKSAARRLAGARNDKNDAHGIR